MNVIALGSRKPQTSKGGVTLFMHVRHTTLIAHLAVPRRHRNAATKVRKTSRINR